MSSPANPSIDGTEKVTFAALFAMSTSAEAVVPVRSIGVPAEPATGSGTVAVPLAVSSRWTVLADSADVSAAVTMAVGSVRTGPFETPLQAATTNVSASAARAVSVGAGRRIIAARVAAMLRTCQTAGSAPPQTLSVIPTAPADSAAAPAARAVPRSGARAGSAAGPTA